MSLWSISFAYRLGLAFHALNNEGAEGSNLMQPRRIDVRDVTYDGISGEIIRRHVLENFVNICRQRQIGMLPLSEGLHPDRGPIGIRAAAKKLGEQELSPDNLFKSVREALKQCSVLDVGGYLAAWQEQPTGEKYVAEKGYLDTSCVPAPRKGVNPVKRESCFDVAWLISEQRQDLTVTQHSAFRDTFELNSRYAQTMRSNTYAGVVRADLHRVGTDDYWYLADGQQRLAIDGAQQRSRQLALVQAIADFIAAPTGAKVAGWAPHVFLTEGAVLLSSSRTAPFVSPIKVNLNDAERPVQAEPTYSDGMRGLANNRDIWVWTFVGAAQLRNAVEGVAAKLEGRLGVGTDAEKTPGGATLA